LVIFDGSSEFREVGLCGFFRFVAVFAGSIGECIFEVSAQN